MKYRAFPVLLVLLGGVTSFLRADQADDTIVAAMKLSAVINYSWTTTVVQNSRGMEIRGQTSADGYSLLTFTSVTPGNATSAAKSAPGNSVNTVFLGDSKYVVERNGAWVVPTATTASAAPPEASKPSSASNPGISTARSKRSRGGNGGSGAVGQRRGSASNEEDSPPPSPYPTIPSGVNLPHEELAIIVANYSEMHFTDGVVSGTLTEWGADQLLVPPGWMQSPPDKAAGTFRLWIKDGAVTKYEVKLTAATGPGGVEVKGGLAKTSTTELSDVGATIVKVPPVAKLKLGA